MPLRNGTPYCINHPERAMIRNEGFSAVVTVTRDANGVTFNPSSGIPLVVYYCDTCGYVEQYVAQKTSFWARTSSESQGASLGRAINFDTLVLDALSGLSRRYPGLQVERNVRFGGANSGEIDAILGKGETVAIVEVKAVTSPTGLGMAAGQVRHSVELYQKNHTQERRQIKPLLIAPAEPGVPSNVLGVAVLRFDLASKAFVDFTVLDALFATWM